MMVLTLESVREMISDLRALGLPAKLVMVSEYDKRELKQELMAMGDSLEESDEDVIGFIHGCMVISHRDVPRGTARILKSHDIGRISSAMH